MSPHRRQQVKPATSSVKWACQWISVTVISYCALILALGAPYIFGHPIKEGELAEHDYSAKQKSLVIDLEQTHRAQEAAKEKVLPVFKRDPAGNQAILGELKVRLDAVQTLEMHKAAAPQGKQPANNDAVSIAGRSTGGSSSPNPSPVAATAGLPREETRLIENIATALPPRDYPAWRAETEHSVQRFLQFVDLFPGGTASHWEYTVSEFLPEKFSPALRDLTARLVATALRPNMVMDQETTKERQQRSIAETKPIRKQIDTGTLIIRKGEQFTPESASVLRQMGITRTYDVHNSVGVAAALFAAFFLFGLFLYTFEPQYFYSPSAIALMATVCVVTCGIASAVGREYPQFVPLPATALVLTVVFGRRVSAILALLVILFLRVCDLVDSAELIALAAATGVAMAVNITKRRELMLAGVMIGVVQAIGYFAAVMFGGIPGSALGVGRGLVQNLLGGLSSSIVAIGSLPFLEMIFGILTPFRVAELSEPDQALLRQLEENAPGTYQHSLAVANLSEAGAKSIGADVNLVRAGAMYHDIGKMVAPRFFIENQLGDKNPHDEIQPEESRARVLAHVTNGLELARKYSLPKQVQDFIPEHQGTTIMAYFYHKACVRDGVENVKELDYRYPGPKPQSKETAIVMLADVSEAVTHSMRDPSQEEVEAAIANVFKARWDDGQFTESGMSDHEMERVKQAFVRVWRTLHHERLKYPSTTTGRMPVPPAMMPAAAVASAAVNAPQTDQADPSEQPSTSTGAEPNGLEPGESSSGSKLNSSSKIPTLPPGADCC